MENDAAAIKQTAGASARLAAERIGEQSRRLVQPFLVPIYERPDGTDRSTLQIGTGFLVVHKGRPVLVTAKHTLYGDSKDKVKDPWTNHIVFKDGLRGLFELAAINIFCDTNNDLCAVYADEFDINRCFPFACLLATDATCAVVTLHGFLARDFRRQIKSGVLKPQPFLCTNQRVKHGEGYIGLLFPRKQYKSTKTGQKVTAPYPKGLSGCPMLDSSELAKGKVVIIGVFTNYKQALGRAFGESTTKVIKLLAQM